MEWKRRDFLKYGAGGMAALVVGSQIPGFLQGEALARKRRRPVVFAQTLNFRITDALKDMGTHNVINPAQCYFWIYKEDHLEAECPGPMIFATEGDVIQIVLTNDLDEPHAFFIPGIFDSGPILPGQTLVSQINLGAKKKKKRPKKKKRGTAGNVASLAGTYLYYDNLNEPVNRVMGLHGAFIVMPRIQVGTPTQRVTPYSAATPGVQQIFNDFGNSAWFPGLAWEQGAADNGPNATPTPAFRQYIWLLHQASPNLFQQVGSMPAGAIMPAADFVTAFLRDPFNAQNLTRIPQYFTINGQHGHFSHNNPYINPNNRVGEPCVIRLLNAGLWTHSMHIHANHVYITCINGTVQENPIWVDVFNIFPLDRVDYTCPYMRPPDVPNARGIGRPDTPLTSPGSTLPPHPVWPPSEELAMFISPEASLPTQLSPLCYPMHDHSEPSQTSQGGNYNMGMIAGMNFTGDRTTPGGVTNFPNQPLVSPPGSTPAGAVNGVFAPTVLPPWFERA
jgi:FtsP/CotA-like multicopper oxidase with cupredoxin domain